jgi:hypothetical protein
MKNLMQRVGDGIGKGVAVGLLGLTLGLGIPAVAHADGNDLQKINELSRALLRIGHEIEDEQNDQQAQDYLNQQKEIQKEQKQYMDNQFELQRKELQKQKDQEYQAQAQLPQNQKHYFACNSSTGWLYPDAYQGIKDVFNVSEPLELVDYDRYAKIGDQWKLDVIGPKGNIVFESKATLQKDGMAMQIGAKDTTRFFYEKGGLGNYRAIFFLNDDETGEADFTIVE